MGEGTVNLSSIVAAFLELLVKLKIRRPTTQEVIDAEKKKVDDEVSESDRTGRPG